MPLFILESGVYSHLLAQKKVLYFLEIGTGNKKYVEYEFIGGFTHLINPLLTYKPLRLIRNYTSTKPDCIGHILNDCPMVAVVKV